MENSRETFRVESSVGMMPCSPLGEFIRKSIAQQDGDLECYTKRLVMQGTLIMSRVV